MYSQSFLRLSIVRAKSEAHNLFKTAFHWHRHTIGQLSTEVRSPEMLYKQTSADNIESSLHTLCRHEAHQGRKVMGRRK